MVAHSYGKTATFMPKPVIDDNGSGMHVHQSIWRDGSRSSPATGYAGPLGERAATTSAALIRHARAINAFTNPLDQQLQAA